MEPPGSVDCLAGNRLVCATHPSLLQLFLCGPHALLPAAGAVGRVSLCSLVDGNLRWTCLRFHSPRPSGKPAVPSMAVAAWADTRQGLLKSHEVTFFPSCYPGVPQACKGALFLSQSWQLASEQVLSTRVFVIPTRPNAQCQLICLFVLIPHHK